MLYDCAERWHTGSALPIILIGVVGLGLLGPYSYLAGAMALDFGGRQGGATSSALIDGIGYLGGIFAGDSVARLAVHYSWGGVFVVLSRHQCCIGGGGGLAVSFSREGKRESLQANNVATVADEVIAIFEKRGESAYYGEDVSQLRTRACRRRIVPVGRVPAALWLWLLWCMTLGIF